MNKKEFEEKFWDFDYDIPKETATLKMLWQWIEQYGKEARINENEKWEKRSKYDRMYMVDFENRIKELKDD